MILRVVETGERVGRVEITPAGNAVFEGWAKRLFSLQRARLGEVGAARALLAEGWSNGYLRLTRD